VVPQVEPSVDRSLVAVLQTFGPETGRQGHRARHRAARRRLAARRQLPRKDSPNVTFNEIDTSSPAATTRLKRQLAEQAISHASMGQWSEAADTNRRLLELGTDAEAENRLAKALWEQGELGAAREHYQAALALDPTNRIAERNIDRLRTLLVAAGEKTVAAADGSRAPVRIFVEETGKTGFAHLLDLPDPKKLAQVNPGDTVELTAENNRLIASSNGMRIGVVEPRVAARLLKLIAEGNKYLAGVTSLGAVDVRIIIREIYQDPRNYGKVSFPTAAKSTDLRPYTKGTLLREEEELEEDLEEDLEDEGIDDIDRVIPPEDTTEEAFVEESDELEES
jgi:tetratricopeptide (TPR) repeat protein